MKVSLSKEKFVSAAFQDVYKATVISGGLQTGEKYDLKRFKEEKSKEENKLFHCVEDHTRKMVHGTQFAIPQRTSPLEINACFE